MWEVGHHGAAGPSCRAFFFSLLFLVSGGRLSIILSSGDHARFRFSEKSMFGLGVWNFDSAPDALTRDGHGSRAG